MATPLHILVVGNNNAAYTDAFRTYVKDNFERLRAQCSILTVNGRTTSRYANNSHAMWLDLGLDPKYCMTADLLNGIDGDTDLTLLTKVYLPDGPTLDAIAIKVNR